MLPDLAIRDSHQDTVLPCHKVLITMLIRSRAVNHFTGISQ